jgi:thiol-disulfide isomerase/thioredoxin
MGKLEKIIAGLVSLFFAMLFLTLFTQTTRGVPSFARRYKLSCSTCHTVFPTLNEYGKFFRANGYRLPGAGGTIEGEKPLGLGPKVREPDAKKPVEIPFIDIPATSVASFQVISDYFYRPDEKVTNEFSGIRSIGLIFGGAMGQRFSFFGNVAIFEDGKFEGVDRLFLQYNRSLAFNIRIGQFEPRAISFSNHRRLLRITKYLNGVFPIIPAQNFFGFSPNQKGIEAFGRLAGPAGIGDFDYALGLVNGEPGGAFEALGEVNGTVASVVRALEEAYEDSGGEFDFNNNKDFYGRLNYNFWLRGAFSLGSFYYKGKSGFLADTEAPESFKKDGNDFNRWGVDLRWDYEKGYVTFLSSVQFFNENLDRPTFNDLSARVTMSEVQFYIFPWLVPGLRFERVDLNDFPTAFPNSFERYSAEVLMLLASNTMVMVGTTWSSDSAPELPLFENFSRLAIHLAF